MHCKSLYLLSFSLAFLAKGIAGNYPSGISQDFEDDDYDYELSDSQTAGLDEEENQSDFYDDDDYLSDANGYDSQNYSRSNEPQECLSPYHRVQLTARHNEARGIGYHDGYTTLEAFGIYDGYSKYFMPFFDLRGHVFNNGKLAGNVGIGERTLMPSINHTLGTYLYYDVRHVGHNLTINQLSPGLELVGKRMEYRINGYFPLGKDETKQYGYEFNKFQGNNILLKSKQQQAMRGGDAEVGVHITQSTKYDLYAAAGTYFIHSSHASAWGGRTRLLGRYKEYVGLEFAYSFDHLFHNVFQGSVAFTLPLGPKLRRTGRGCPQGNDLLLSRASFAPSRFEIPVVKKVHRKQKAINPATGQPWTVWFVNNTSSSKGTIESPFPTLLEAQNASSFGDMIYVFPGDGTTKGMDAGIVLKDQQLLFGSANSHKIKTTKGNVTIKSFSKTAPTITNPTGNVVTMVNGDTVSGFNILAPAASGSGIDMPLALTNGAIITNNNITVTGGFAGIIVDNALTGVVNISRNQITSNEGSSTAIFLQFTNTQNATISQNNIVGFATAIDVENVVGGSAPFSLQLNQNSISNFANLGMLFNVLNNATITVSENQFNSNISGNPCIIANRVLSSSITNNSITTNLSGIDVRSTGSAGLQLTTDISNNIINVTGSGGFGIENRTTGSDSFCSTISNNQVITPVGVSGLTITASGSGKIDIDDLSGNVAQNVTISGNVNLVPEGTCNP